MRQSFLPKMSNGDVLYAAWAEHANGPGWSNALVWCLIRSIAGDFRVEAIQPDRHTPEILALFRVSEACMESMKAATAALLKVERR